jgi:hypothetical protein
MLLSVLLTSVALPLAMAEKQDEPCSALQLVYGIAAASIENYIKC